MEKKKKNHTITRRLHFFLNTYTKTAVSDKNVLGKRKNYRKVFFFPPMRKKSALYAITRQHHMIFF